MIEPLEARIAPAALNPAGTLLTYTDLDGDLVKVAFSGGVTMEASDFTFTNGSVNGDITTKQALTQVDLTGKNGGGFKLTATPPRIAGLLQGDSHANIVTILGTGTNLGTINVDGDVTSITAGVGLADGVGLKSFTALSIGRGNTSITADSTVINAGSFSVKTDVMNAVLTFTGGVKTLSIGGNLEETKSAARARIVATGEVGSVKIGGSVIGRSGGQSNIDLSGGTVGTLSIGGSIIGGLSTITDGGAQVRIVSGSVKTFSVGGDVIGGAGQGGGSISLRGGGSVKIGGSLIAADDVTLSGQLQILGSVQSLTIGGSIVGGHATGPNAVTNNGTVFVTGNVGTFKLGRDFLGGRDAQGTLTNSSLISVGGTIGTLTIGGSVTGSSSNPLYISVGGDFVDGPVAAIKTLSVKGSVLFASILAGYEFGANARNADAGFGSIAIGGNLVGSFISFGTSKGTDGIPGTTDDGGASNLATVNSIKIGGSFSGIAGEDTTYYIYGSILKKLTIGKASYAQSQISVLQFNSIGKATATSFT